MTEILYPDGYGTARITMAEMQRRHSSGMEPEYARRLFAWLASKKGKFGIGGGWRPTPSNVSQASREGKSFHQTQTYSDRTKWYAAVDLVVYVGGGKLHRAPYRSEVPWQGQAITKNIGLHMNIDTETWHMQAIEMDGWQSWYNAGRKRPVKGYAITLPPVVVQPPVSLPPAFPPFSPQTGNFSLWPIATNKPVLKLGMTGQPMDAIRYFQGVMLVRAKYVISVDGFYGSQSVAAARAIRKWNGLPAGDTVDAAVWKVIDKLALQ